MTSLGLGILGIYIFILLLGGLLQILGGVIEFFKDIFLGLKKDLPVLINWSSPQRATVLVTPYEPRITTRKSEVSREEKEAESQKANRQREIDRKFDLLFKAQDQNKLFSRIWTKSNNKLVSERDLENHLVHELVSLASTIGNPEINQDVNSFLLLRLKPQDDLSGGYISYFLKRVSFLYRDFELKKIRLEERNRKEEINKMSGVDFESFVRDYLTDKGAVCEMTPASGDYGADIIAKVEGRRIAIQCKRYSANVGYSAVQEVVAGKAYYKCDEAWVVTNASFTQQAIQGAKKMDVKLHNIFELMNKCKN